MRTWIYDCRRSDPDSGSPRRRLRRRIHSLVSRSCQSCSRSSRPRSLTHTPNGQHLQNHNRILHQSRRHGHLAPCFCHNRFRIGFVPRVHPGVRGFCARSHHKHLFKFSRRSDRYCISCKNRDAIKENKSTVTKNNTKEKRGNFHLG